MSLSIIKNPPKFQPVYSDGLFFTVSADTTNTYKFRYVYDVYVNGDLVFQGKSTPNPYDLGVVDLSRVIKTYTTNNPISLWNNTPIYTHQTFPFSRPYENEVINYNVLFGYEYSNTANGEITGFTGNDSGVIVGSPGVDTGIYKTFYSTMGVNGRATQQDFDMSPFVLSGSPVGTYPTTSGLFLTNSPRIRDIQTTEYYTLAFTNYYLDSGSMLSQPYYVEYNFYDDEGVLLDTAQYQNITINGGGPLVDCSAVYQSYYNTVGTGTTEWNTLYVGAGPMNLQSIMPAGTAQYTVQLFGNFTGETSPPAPTPTPTPTPSATPGCGTCYTYDIENPSQVSTAIVYYTECAIGPVRVISIPPQTVARIDCACDGSLIYEAALIITVVSSCTSVSPTPTPTPTPSATPCVCEAYTVDNNSLEAQAFVDYTDCNGTAQHLVLDPFTGLSFCACLGTIATTGDTTTYDSGLCTPAPTPNPTPTPSATPPYCECVEYQVDNESPVFQNFTYTDCYGVIQSVNLAGFQTTYVCACRDSVSGTVYVSEIGTC